MNLKATFSICLTASLFFGYQVSAAPVTVLLDNGGGSLTTVGDALDDIDPSEIGSSVAGPHNVPEIPGLQITVTGVFSSDDGEETNTTTTSLGVNSDTDTDTDAFEAAFNQSVTLQFNKDVLVYALDFTSFTAGEEFSFDGVIIGNDDLSNGTTDVYDFATPYAISADTDFVLTATAGTIGIEAFDIQVVPEPASFALLGGLGVFGLARRRRSC